MFTNTDPGTKGTTDGELLRLVSELKTLVQGAAPDAMARLGTERLTTFREALLKEQEAIRNAAVKVKAAINSSLSVEALANLGMKRLQELGVGVGLKIDASPYAGYNLNEVMEEALRVGRGGSAG